MSNTFPFVRWIQVEPVDRLDVIEHLREEAKDLAVNGDTTGARRYFAAAEVLADVLYLPELVETTA